MSVIDTQPYISEGEALLDSWCNQEPSWLNHLRRAALYDFHERGFPGTKVEAWKYTRLDHLLRQPYHLATQTERSVLDGELPWLEQARHRLLMINGNPKLQASQLGSLPEGVKVQSFQQTLQQEPAFLQNLWTQQFQNAEDGLQALNLGLINDGVVIEVDDNCQLDTPLHIIHLTNVTAPSAVFGVVVLKLGRDAQASVLESFVSTSEADYFSNNHTVVELADNAELHHYKLQSEPSQASHFAVRRVHQSTSSRYYSFSLGLGSRLMRDEMAVALDGSGAECYLNGLFLADEHQHHDFHLSVIHQSPNCLSREFYRGIANDHGHGVFDGTVVVKPHAQCSDAVMSTKNLLLSPHAEIDAKPRLEIYADDVKCAHGATVGQIDDEALFYLRSRGLDADGARALLTFAFVNEVLEKIDNKAIRSALRTDVVAQLPHSDSIKEGLWL